MDDSKLAALLKQEAPPAQDFAFTLAVMARIEKRQFRQAMARNIALGLLAMLALGLSAPALSLAWGRIAPSLSNNLVIAALLLAGFVVALPWMQPD